MKIDVARCIREVLDDRQTVSLIGLGSLRLENYPAKFGEKRKVLLPPSVDITFDSSTSSNNALISRISKVNNLSKEEASTIIQKYSDSVLNALLNFDKAYLTGIGTFKKNKSGEIEFKSDPKFVGQYYKGLPTIDIEIVKPKPLETTEVVSEPAIISSTPIVDVKSKEDPEASEPVEMSVESSEIKSTSVEPPAFVPPSPFLEKSQEEESHNRNWLWIILALALLAAIIFLTMRACNYYQDSQKLNDPQIVESHPTDALLADENAELDSDTANGGNVIPGKCIIITGVFATDANAQRMNEKLSNEGYEVYTEENGPYKRVGLSFECDNINLEDYIQDVRAKIAPKAWYLDPELYVEYN